MPGAKALKATGKLIRKSSSSVNYLCAFVYAKPLLLIRFKTQMAVRRRPRFQVLNVLSLRYLLLVTVGDLWRSFHVPGRCLHPHPGDRKLGEGCLEEGQWGLGEGVYRVSAEGQKLCRGV